MHPLQQHQLADLSITDRLRATDRRRRHRAPTVPAVRLRPRRTGSDGWWPIPHSTRT
jgi:hypothetical protein